MIGWALQKAHLFLLRHTVQPLALPSAIHCFTATMPALTVTLSANGDGSALGASLNIENMKAFWTVSVFLVMNNN